MKFDQREYDKQPVSLSEILTLYGVAGIFMVLIGLEIFSQYEPRKLAALMFVLWWMLLVFLHEFGHAVVAKWLGWRVNRTVIGFGRVMFHGTLFGAPMEVRMVPVEGFVQIAPNDVHGARYKSALIYFAGPGIELLLFLVIMLTMGVSHFFVIEDDYGKLALQSLAFAAAAGAIINLIPMGVVTRDGETPNDGMGILLSLFSKKQDYQKWVDEARRERENQREM